MATEERTRTVTRYLRALLNAKQEAERENALTDLWHRVFPAALAIAIERASDLNFEALASESLCDVLTGLSERRHKSLDNSKSFWRFFKKVLRRDIADSLKYRSAECRGGEKTERPFADGADSLIPQPRESSLPEEIAFEEVRQLAELILRIEDETLIEIAYLNVYEQQSSQAICERLQISPATLKRKKRLIREKVKGYEDQLRRKDRHA